MQIISSHVIRIALDIAPSKAHAQNTSAGDPVIFTSADQWIINFTPPPIDFGCEVTECDNKELNEPIQSTSILHINR